MKLNAVADQIIQRIKKQRETSRDQQIHGPSGTLPCPALMPDSTDAKACESTSMAADPRRSGESRERKAAEAASAKPLALEGRGRLRNTAPETPTTTECNKGHRMPGPVQITEAHLRHKQTVNPTDPKPDKLLGPVHARYNNITHIHILKREEHGGS
jgi:hypothetical protein